MPGKFELYKDKKGEFRFRLKATNGQIILASEGYKAKPSAKNGIESVRKNAVIAERYEKKSTRSGLFSFALKSINGRVIGTSQSYKTEISQKNGMASVKKNAPGAKFEDQTLSA